MEPTTQNITVKELLTITADGLGRIMVPVELGNAIASPIWKAVQNIRKCVEALEAAERQAAEEGEDPEAAAADEDEEA